ncbi:MAG TPA: ATP-binding protein [Longimicrobium sp.]|uniref:PAS domain-containing sensor histidine kinase n=1 Tax=Longimicrobium sp. TaxID=2029185 RepID=UPI002ED793E7
MAQRSEQHEVPDPFAGPGEMRERCRALDWSSTPLGPVETWPQSLRTAAGMALASGFPEVVCWGPRLIQIYNDGYIPITGAKHPWALGRPTTEVWPEVWHLNGPLFARAQAGETATVVDAPYTLHRNGPDAPPDETFFTLSFSPIRDEAGAVGGVLVTAIETTRDVEARRLQSERESLFRDLEVERARLAFVFHRAPSFLAVLRGPDHVFELANEAYYQLVGDRDILGKRVLDALPEVRGQGFQELLDGVLQTGEPMIGREMPVTLARTRGEAPEQRFVDLAYIPLLDAAGEREGIIAHGMDVTDHVLARREAERLLHDARAARAEAEAANRAKSEFLATMSHELRTPINAMMGYTELLEMGIGGPVTAAQREHLGRIRSSSLHLLGLIDDVLDLARIEAGRMTVAREPAAAAPIVAAALELVEPQAAERGLRLENLCGGESARFLGDADRVRQILANLLSNAVKFTPAGGRISVDCQVRGEPGSGGWLRDGGPWLCIRVHDTGIGIEPGFLERVFRPFVQADTGHTRAHGGTGLGLSISREYARLMGGDLTARSEPGRGSRFTLWLPTTDAAPVDRHAVHPPSAGLVVAGKAVQADVDVLVAAYRDRVRADPVFPAAATLTDSEIEDHVSSFLADIAQSLVILGETGGQPDLLRDGSDLQRLISERHGAQRARLQWTEEGLRAEFSALKEEVDALLRRRDAPERDAALRVLGRLLDRACEISVRAFRLAQSSLSAEREDVHARTESVIAQTRRTISAVKDSVARDDGGFGARPRPGVDDEMR